MFTSTRIFAQTNFKTGVNEWFFNSREGVIGPFFTQDKAEYALREFIKFNIEMGNSGGRGVVRNAQAKPNLDQRLHMLLAKADVENLFYHPQQLGLE